MKCPECFDEQNGHYSNIEDYNPGSEPEWSYYECWTCLNCGHSIYSYEEGFVYEDNL